MIGKYFFERCFQVCYYLIFILLDYCVVKKCFFEIYLDEVKKKVEVIYG